MKQVIRLGILYAFVMILTALLPARVTREQLLDEEGKNFALL